MHELAPTAHPLDLSFVAPVAKTQFTQSAKTASAPRPAGFPVGDFA
jgi:hypothetical protein